MRCVYVAYNNIKCLLFLLASVLNSTQKYSFDILPIFRFTLSLASLGKTTTKTQDKTIVLGK